MQLETVQLLKHKVYSPPLNVGVFIPAHGGNEIGESDLFTTRKSIALKNNFSDHNFVVSFQ